MYKRQLSVSEPLDVFVGDVIAKTGYEAMLKAMKEEGEARRENLGQLVSSIKTYADQNGEDATLSGFLEEVALISDLDLSLIHIYTVYVDFVAVSSLIYAHGDADGLCRGRDRPLPAHFEGG